MRTVLITGASTGIGKATAILFQQRGWNVVATMRSPQKAADLANLERITCLPLDVTDPDSIRSAIATSLEKFTTIDVIVNNAGYGLVGAFETSTREQIQRQFDTNVFGLMEVTRAILPHFRARKQGVIVNITSMGGRLTFPLYSLYHGTKWAVEGFSEALQFELRPFNIRVKIVEPGPIKTDFYDRSADVTANPEIPDYDRFIAKVLPKTNQAGVDGAPPEAVAEVIYKASTDRSWKLRYPAGGIGSLLLLRKFLPEGWFTALVNRLLVD
ncbi:SDR family oxidoreductase [Pseudanabaena sp. PCC 6802]|uniref:SDR family oxidoreductase n=1 Tax=Pseudanabaena sp. PCC 6802 TaxID=118173 RepID=UPI000347599F|nr:SDR family oxidoreductase [Pseudanabaena sp. PCC 6802]